MSLTVFYTAKGGQGCTVTAAGYARVHSDQSPTLLIDAAPSGDCAAVLGAPDDGRLTLEAIPGQLTTTRYSGYQDFDELLCASAGDVDCFVADAGCVDWDNLSFAMRNLFEVASRKLLVTTSCYLSLRRVAELPDSAKPDGVVFVRQDGRALDALDVADVVGRPVIGEIGWDAAITRTVDAGLLCSRIPRRMLDSWTLLAEELVA